MQMSLAYISIVLAGALMAFTHDALVLLSALVAFFAIACLAGLLMGFDTFIRGFEYTMVLVGAYCLGTALLYLTQGALRRLRP